MSTIPLFALLLLIACDHGQTGLVATPPRSIAEPSLPTGPARLKILTWNIWMMPWFTFQSPHNQKRARAIAGELLKLDFDILCFEKAFDSGARDVLATVLGGRYPHRYGPANSGFSVKVNSGVWILSRIPLSERHDAQFRDCAGIECASRKGAMLLSGTLEGHAFQILATHLEGEAGAHYTSERQDIRNRQMIQIRDDLLTPFARSGVPLFLCGDFDTPHRNPANATQESSGYRFMLRTFNAENGPGDRITFDDNRSRNDLAISNQGRADELDYILVVPKGVNLGATWRREILRHPGWDSRHQDLSYRYAVGASIQFR